MVTKARAALQTYHAIQATDLASAFNDALKKIRIGPGDYMPELTEPEGPSTAGGVQAMQHIRLVSQSGQPTLLVGHADHAQEHAELRTFEHLDAVHRQRFRRPVPIDRAQYEDFLRLAKQFLEVLRLRTTLTGAPLDLEDRSASGSGAGKVIVGVLLVLVLAAAGFAAWRILGRG